jgi:hypothetical protein
VNTGPVRSMALIDRSDLLRLAELAAEVEAGLFARNPESTGATPVGFCAGLSARVQPCIM